MITNNFIEEMEKLGYTVNYKEDKLILKKGLNEIELTLEKVRRICLNAIVSHIDTHWN